MSTIELQNILIRKILDIDKPEILEQIEALLYNLKPGEKVHLSDLEEAFVQKSEAQINEGKYLTNDEVIEKTEKWLGE